MAVVKKVKNQQNNMKDVLKKERRLPGDKSSKSSKKPEAENVDDKKVGYFKGSWRELKRVTWPGRKESWKMTFAVILFTVGFSAFTTGLDFILEKVVRQIFL